MSITKGLQKGKKYLEKTRNLVFLSFATFFLFTLIARVEYFWPYSVFTDWISNLGNPLLNPRGAFWFNAGVIFSGIMLIIVFARAINSLLSIAGILMSVFFILVGAHSSDQIVEHSLFASYFFIATTICIMLITVFVRNKRFTITGLVLISINTFYLACAPYPIWEWVAFILDFFFIHAIAFLNPGFFQKRRELGK